MIFILHYHTKTIVIIMRKNVLYLLAVLFLPLFVSCSNDEEDNLNLGLDTEHIYAVGDPYPYTGKPVGVVCLITDGGKHGIIIDLWDVEWHDGIYPFPKEYELFTLDDGMLNMKNALQRPNHYRFKPMHLVHEKNKSNVVYQKNATGIWYIPARDEWTSILNSIFEGKDEWEVDRYNTGYCPSWQYDGKNDNLYTSFNNKLVAAGGEALVHNGYHTSSINPKAGICVVAYRKNPQIDYTTYTTGCRGRAFLNF